jgi:pseudoazurin
MEKKMRIPVLLLALAGAAAAATPAMAADHVVKMLNKGPSGIMVFEPPLVHVKPGDKVTFVPTDKSHNAESIPGMAPAGAAAFKGKMNQPVTVTFAKPGLYGYKCAPHYGMGMVGAVVVGTAKPNLPAALAVKHPGKAKQVMAGLLARTR